MTPQGILGNNQSSSPSNPNIYNQVSSMGMAGQEAPDASKEQPQMESLVEKAMKQFGAIFNSVTELFESYPGSDKEASAVKNALANWMNSTANKINENQGSSTY